MAHSGSDSVNSSEVEVVKTATFIHVPPDHLVDPPQQCHTQNGHYSIQDGCREKRGRGEGERENEEEA